MQCRGRSKSVCPGWLPDPGLPTPTAFWASYPQDLLGVALSSWEPLAPVPTFQGCPASAAPFCLSLPYWRPGGGTIVPRPGFQAWLGGVSLSSASFWPLLWEMMGLLGYNSCSPSLSCLQCWWKSGGGEWALGGNLLEGLAQSIWEGHFVGYFKSPKKCAYPRLFPYDIFQKGELLGRRFSYEESVMRLVSHILLLSKCPTWRYWIHKPWYLIQWNTQA